MVEEDDDALPAADGKRRGKRKGNRGTGRRDLRALPLEEERIEIPDPHLEALVAEGKVTRHGFEETCKIGHKRGGKRRIVIARVRYKTVDAAGNTDAITTAMPEQMHPGSIAAPSLVAHLIMENIGKGMPLFRIEDSCVRDGIPVDRGSLSRWKKTVGDRLGETVVASGLGQPPRSNQVREPAVPKGRTASVRQQSRLAGVPVPLMVRPGKWRTVREARNCRAPSALHLRPWSSSHQMLDALVSSTVNDAVAPV